MVAARAQRKAELPQGSRLIAAVAYLALLTLLARYLNGSYLPPFGLPGVWFYAAFAALLLGVLLLEPHYTTPKEALANGSAVLLLAASITYTETHVQAATFQAGRYTFIGLASLAILFATDLFARGAVSLAVSGDHMIAGLGDKGLACSTDAGITWERRCTGS